jgi:uncharacterized FAD-dependent dehydrogenase
MIDKARFATPFHPQLGAADYKLVHHAKQWPRRFTASACAPAARWWPRPPKRPGRVVTNGMSQYSRNERNANAGMVVGIDPSDYPTRHIGLSPATAWRSSIPWPASCFSASSKSRAFAAWAAAPTAPGQLVGDFIAGQASSAGRGGAVLQARRDA